MFPTRLSILSPDKRAHLKKLLYLQFFKNGLEILLVGLTVSGIVILCGWWILQSHFNDLVTSINFITNRDTRRNAEIRDLNSSVSKLDALQKEYTQWTPIFVEIFSSIPPSIMITGIKLDHGTGIYVLSGVAETRADLLYFRDQFAKNPSIQTVDVPLSQLTEKTDIAFTLTATTKNAKPK